MGALTDSELLVAELFWALWLLSLSRVMLPTEALDSAKFRQITTEYKAMGRVSVKRLSCPECSMTFGRISSKAPKPMRCNSSMTWRQNQMANLFPVSLP